MHTRDDHSRGPMIGLAIGLLSALACQGPGPRAPETPEDALAVLNQRLEREPKSATLLEARGVLYASLGYQRAAERDFQSVTRLRPDHVAGWLALGRARLELVLNRGAREALEGAQRRGCDLPELHLALAQARRDLNPGARPE